MAIVLFLFVFALFFIYKWMRQDEEFFIERGVRHEKPKLLFGNLFGLFTGRENGASLFEFIPKKFPNEK